MPVVGQTTGFAGQAAADIGRGQLDQAVFEHKRAATGHGNKVNLLRCEARLQATLANHADDLPCQGVVCALFDGRLGTFGVQAVAVRQADRHFSAAQVDAGFQANKGRKGVGCSP